AAWFDQRLHVQAVQRMQVEQELRAAVTGGQLLAHYQPAYDLLTGAAVHIEALARWQHPARGLIPPAAFIPVAEESGLITAVGEIVLATAAAQAHRWSDVPDLRVWVNVSPRQLAGASLTDLLARTLERSGIPAERLGIEVTESVMAERGRLRSELEAVHSLGVAIAIDDFGTGYSSLARLSAMPFDVIKIDRSFVAQLGTVTGDALVSAIVTLSHSIGAHVIAEGVETQAQLDQVAASGCDSAAGYFMARPGPADDVRWQIPVGSALLQEAGSAGVVPVRGALHLR
ncbi:MAG: diguanylate cyclase/phosphodiesterase with and sensor(s), partial [Actinotalea sp.]|nr:diguanylate cyclase/phosphodiesterase with and sensor(s) [Actinotalea sp.]